MALGESGEKGGNALGRVGEGRMGRGEDGIGGEWSEGENTLGRVQEGGGENMALGESGTKGKTALGRVQEGGVGEGRTWRTAEEEASMALGRRESEGRGDHGFESVGREERGLQKMASKRREGGEIMALGRRVVGGKRQGGKSLFVLMLIGSHCH